MTDIKKEEILQEFLERLERVDNELELLKTDRKELIQEFKGKLDVKSVQAALKIQKIRSKVDSLETLDEFLDMLETEE